MSYGCCHGENHAEAVEHRNLDHHAVEGRQIHAVADRLTVVNYVVVCEHNALRESCCTGCVLHVADIVLINCAANLFNVGNTYLLCQSGKLIPVEASGNVGFTSDNVL